MKKKYKKKKKFKKKTYLLKRPKKNKKAKKKNYKNKIKRIKRTSKRRKKPVKENYRVKKTKNENLVLKLVKLQLSLKPEFNFKINFNLEKYIQGFFDKISETISNYKIIKQDEKRRLKLEKIENERKAKIAIEQQKKEEEALKVKLKEQSLKEETRLEKQTIGTD